MGEDLSGWTWRIAGGAIVVVVISVGLWSILSKEEDGRSAEIEHNRDAAPSNRAVIEFRNGLADKQSVVVLAYAGGKSSRNALGSGVVVKKVGNTCFLLTARHVASGPGGGARIPVARLYDEWSGNIGSLWDEVSKVDIWDQRFSPLIYRDQEGDWAILVMRDVSHKARAALNTDGRELSNS